MARQGRCHETHSWDKNGIASKSDGRADFETLAKNFNN